MTWYEDLYSHVDRKDMDAVALWFSDDVVMTMGNSEPIVGRADVVAALRQFQATLAGLSHTFLAVIEQGDAAMLETSTRFGSTAVRPWSSRASRSSNAPTG